MKESYIKEFFLAFDLEELLTFGIVVLHLLRFSVPWNDKLYIRIIKLSLLKGLTFNTTVLAFARLTGLQKNMLVVFPSVSKGSITRHKSLMGFFKSVMPVKASITFFEMATGF